MTFVWYEMSNRTTILISKILKTVCVTGKCGMAYWTYLCLCILLLGKKRSSQLFCYKKIVIRLWAKFFGNLLLITYKLFKYKSIDQIKLSVIPNINILLYLQSDAGIEYRILVEWKHIFYQAMQQHFLNEDAEETVFN